MTDRLFALGLFLRVARSGSFSAAARELGISQPSASRIVADLERTVGASLLTRTTHGLTLTEAGGDYLSRVAPILAALEEADHAARGGTELRGLVRVAAPPTFIARELVPRLGCFLEQHPALQVELVAADHRLELVRTGVDVAFRFGPPPDGGAVGRKLAELPRVLVAAPSYLQRHGTPDRPEALADHMAIGSPASRGQGAWAFERDGGTVAVTIRNRLTFSDTESAMTAAAAGLGVMSTGLWSCRTELAQGMLLRLLPAWSLGTVGLHVVLAAGRAAKPSARGFVAHMARELRHGQAVARNAFPDRRPWPVPRDGSPARRVTQHGMICRPAFGRSLPHRDEPKQHHPSLRVAVLRCASGRPDAHRSDLVPLSPARGDQAGSAAAIGGAVDVSPVMALETRLQVAVRRFQRRGRFLRRCGLPQRGWSARQDERDAEQEHRHHGNRPAVGRKATGSWQYVPPKSDGGQGSCRPACAAAVSLAGRSTCPGAPALSGKAWQGRP